MKRKRGLPTSTRSSARLRTDDDGDEMGSRFIEIENEPEDHDIEDTPPIQPFRLLDLPRKLRNLIYGYHLESIYETSRSRNLVSNHNHYPNSGSDKFSNAEYEFESNQAPTRRGFEGCFYEPVFQRRHVTYDLNPHVYDPREHPLPALTLTGGNVLAKEAWEYYTERLMVHVDALNRFQTWCQEVIRPERFAALTKLYIMAMAVYGPPPDTLKTGGITDERYPVFLIQISPDRRSITVCTRFELLTPDSHILLANLDVLMKPRLTLKRELDGEDVVEAMFAMHNMKARESREDLVIGPFTKGRVNWRFGVDQQALDKVSRVDKSESQVLVEAAMRVKTFECVLWRGEVERGS